MFFIDHILSVEQSQITKIKTLCSSENILQNISSASSIVSLLVCTFCNYVNSWNTGQRQVSCLLVYMI